MKSRAPTSAGAPSRQTVTLALLAAASVAMLVLARGAETDPSFTTNVVPRAQSPLRSDRLTAETCAPCHEKEFSEWRRSVMAFAAKSPLYVSLESAVEEQVERSDRCPSGAGVLRRAGAASAACIAPTGVSVTGSGGEQWCVNCHAPLEHLESAGPGWNAQAASRQGAAGPTLPEALGAAGRDGVTCVACHASVGPVAVHAARFAGNGSNPTYEGNPSWRSLRTGAEFLMRPEDARGIPGISNSGFRLAGGSFFTTRIDASSAIVHARPSRAHHDYLESSEFCGSCHDVRLFGTDVLGGEQRGEHFKRLRNAYSEWREWADGERRLGRNAATCQHCHMSDFPGHCEAGAARVDRKSDSCPPGTGFVAAGPPSRPIGEPSPSAVSHYFTGVEVPFAPEFPESFADERALDERGVPVGSRQRRDMLLRSALSLAIEGGPVDERGLNFTVVLENVGAGHRVPAGFSQEREFWVELRVTDARGRVVYEVGRIDRADEDLHDKEFLKVTTDVANANRDDAGRPLGMFGADVRDGPDVPRWVSEPRASPGRESRAFRGRGLINLQNGFLRCVRCRGPIGTDGKCDSTDPNALRSARFDDGEYDLDTGECRSNLSGENRLFETYFPVGSLDSTRGILRAPDAIIDTRSAPPAIPLRYTYVLEEAGGRPGPFRIAARLRFRAFPPFLVKAFVAYERAQDRAGERPKGPRMTETMLSRLDVVDLADAELVIP